MEYCWSLFNNNRGAWLDNSSFTVDPHFTTLKLGKRHYLEDAEPSTSKKGKSYAVVPRCQVEGCAAPLVNAKDYHRRHKVCQIHSKAPKVLLLGIEQRFCQQCSRFHGVAEFDEAKRSCRRRLAGHNERRRKSSQQQNALASASASARRHYYYSQDMKMMMGREIKSSECALSLLSTSSSRSSPGLPARCSAALRELIAENRASCRQIEEDYKLGSIQPQPQGSGAHVTLNLMQAPNSAFALLPSMHHHHKDHQHCSDLWNLPLGYSLI